MQLMRSWLVGMPGEHVSCVGCHEDRRASLPLRQSLANRRGAQPLAAVVRPAAAVRLRPRGLSGAGAILHRLPRRQAGGRPAQQAVVQDARPGLRHVASVRAPAGRRVRHGHAQPDGVPRLDQPAGPDAGKGPPRRQAGRHEPRGARAALLLDRPERSAQRQLESTRVAELRSAPAPRASWPRCLPTTTPTRRPSCSAADRGLQEATAGRVRRASADEEPAKPDGLQAAGFPFDRVGGPPAASKPSSGGRRRRSSIWATG